MNNALRVTVIVFVLVIITVIAGNFIKNHFAGKVDKYRIQINDLDQKIANIDSLMALSEQKREILEAKKEEAEKFDKFSLPYDSPPVTFDYLLDLMHQIREDLRFDFNYSGQKTENNYILNSYMIKGKASLPDVYKLVANLERQKPLYYIHDFAMSAKAYTTTDSVSYSFLLSSVSKNIIPQPVSIELKDVNLDIGVDSLFTCGLLVDRLAAERARELRNKDLLNPDALRLIAITDAEVLFRDERGIFQVLKIGDKVKNGVLSAIDPAEGAVSFTINTDEGKKEKILFINKEVQK